MMINDTHCTVRRTAHTDEERTTKCHVINKIQRDKRGRPGTWSEERIHIIELSYYNMYKLVSVVPHSNVEEGVDRSAKALQ